MGGHHDQAWFCSMLYAALYDMHEIRPNFIKPLSTWVTYLQKTAGNYLVTKYPYVRQALDVP